MTTKVNPFMQRGPGKVRMGTGVPGTMPAPRIVIDVDPNGGGTSLRTEGPLTIPTVIDILIGQLATLWGRWMQDVMKQSGIVDPKTGLPLAAVPSTPGTPAPAGGTGEPEPCKHEYLNMEGICHGCGADCRSGKPS